MEYTSALASYSFEVEEAVNSFTVNNIGVNAVIKVDEIDENNAKGQRNIIPELSVMQIDAYQRCLFSTKGFLTFGATNVNTLDLILGAGGDIHLNSKKRYKITVTGDSTSNTYWISHNTSNMGTPVRVTKEYFKQSPNEFDLDLQDAVVIFDDEGGVEDSMLKKITWNSPLKYDAQGRPEQFKVVKHDTNDRLSFERALGIKRYNTVSSEYEVSFDYISPVRTNDMPQLVRAYTVGALNLYRVLIKG